MSWFTFLKFVGVKDSNEVKVLAILEALRIFSGFFKWKLMVESNSLNAITWVSTFALRASVFFQRDQAFVFPLTNRVPSCC